jgi:Ras-related protein Rab-22
MNLDSKPREVKVVLLGDTGVGKSSLVLRFVTNNFKPYSESTIGASFMSKMITVESKQIKFQIWDTAGQEKYHSLAPMYYRGAAAAIIVYDITRPNTFNILKNWVEELRSKGPKDIAIAIAGNKADLANRREVDQAMAQAYAEEIGAMYVETSAKDDLNVQDIFVKLSYRLPAPPQTDSSILKGTTQGLKNPRQTPPKSGCC